MATNFITSIIDKVPEYISVIRNMVIKAINMANLPGDDIYLMIAAAISLFLAYKLIKAWTVANVFTSASLLIKYLGISFLFYLVLAYVGR